MLCIDETNSRPGIHIPVCMCAAIRWVAVVMTETIKGSRDRPKVTECELREIREKFSTMPIEQQNGVLVRALEISVVDINELKNDIILLISENTALRLQVEILVEDAKTQYD